MHHKHGNAQAGCKVCQPWNADRFRAGRPAGESFDDHRRRSAAIRAARHA